MSKLPLSTNMGALTGDIYLRPLLPTPADRAYSAGFADSASISMDVSSEDIYAVVDGVRTKVDTWITEKGGSVSITMRELRADHVATALMATTAALTQTSVSAATKTASDVKAGELVELGKLDVTSVIVEAGATTLVADVDYTLYAKSGDIVFRGDFEDVEITYSAPAIAADANRVVSSILTSPDGLVCELIIIGRNARGQQYKTSGVHVALKPSGEFMLAGDGSSIQEITLEGSLKINPASPTSPFGHLEQLS